MCKRGEEILILQEEFIKNGYKDITVVENDNTYLINLDDLYDLGNRPNELLGIFISEQQDELFFLLNGDEIEINKLCDLWDDRIRVFMIINGKSPIIQKLKYNIVQLVIYSNGIRDKNREGNLMISRKIIIRGNMEDKERIEIKDDEVIELPFYMIPADPFLPDEELINTLSRFLPTDENVLEILKKKPKKVSGKNENGISKKSFEIQEYDIIKEWLKE